MTAPSSERLPSLDQEAEEFSARAAISILRRYMRHAVLVGIGAGLLVHLAGAIWAAQAETVYSARFEVRYKAGTNILAGLSGLLGRDMPSLRDRTSIETQLEILGGRKVRLEALKHVKAYSGFVLKSKDPKVVVWDELKLEAQAADYDVSIRVTPSTDIIVVTVLGHDRSNVQQYAEGLLKAYRTQDVRSKRLKDTAMGTYVKQQIVVQEKKLARLFEVTSAHKQVAPLETRRDRAKARVEAAEESMREERRNRRNKRDALLSNYTPEHPAVLRAEEAMEALTTIAAAQSEAELRTFVGGSEAQWAALRADGFEETRQVEQLEARIQKIRAGIGDRFKELLRAGSDPEHVQREYRLAQETYESLRRRLNQVDLTIQDTSSDVDTLSDPDVREQPVRTRWQWGIAAALICGLLTPFVLESVVLTSHTVEDLERASGLPVLAMIPKLDESSTNGSGLLVRGCAASDELRLLRTNIESALDYPPRRLILVAGAEPGEGKSMIAANLAAVYAEMGVPTLLVDLDLRRPTDHKLLNVRRSPGIAEVINDTIPWKRAVQIPSVDNLHVLPAGEPVEDSGGLLATVRLAEVLNEMREVFSVVICDSPALSAVADASLVARQADAVVLVYALATTPHRSLARTINMLNTTRAKVVGVVANDVRGLNSKRAYRYRYYYEKKR